MISGESSSALFGGAAVAWPLAAQAQQTAMPAIGVPRQHHRPSLRAHLVTAFREGVFNRPGYALGPERGDGVSLGSKISTIDCLDLLADLIRRKVAVIACVRTPPALAAKAANTNIPIVFATRGDPVKDRHRRDFQSTRVVTSPGVSFMVMELGGKAAWAVYESLPGTVRLAVLVDPNFPITALFCL